MNGEEQEVSHSVRTSPNLLCYTHWAVLIGGCLAGIAAAVAVIRIPLDFSGELAAANRLGIVSLTILNGYPKSRDILLYVALVLLPVMGSLGVWLVWSRGRRPALAELFRDEPEVQPVPHHNRWVVLAVVFAFLLVTFDINSFYEPIGGWRLLGEQGQFLGWTQSILGGGVYARDFYCLYGPLLVYPLAWAMKLLGASLVTVKAYAYGLDLLARAILLLFLHQAIRSRAVFIFAALFSILTCGGSGLGYPNGSGLRVFLGLLPLLILHRYAGSGRNMPLVASGVAVGLSLLFSQEAGFCAVAATAVFVCLEARRAKDFRLLARQGGLVAAGCLMALAPILIYFHQQGALSGFFDSLYGYPRLVTLGYVALPFPSFGDFLAAPLTSEAFVPYFIIGIYIIAAISFLVRLFLGPGNRDLHLRVSLLLFGLLLFRAALGRSDASHFFAYSAPALLLLFLLLDDAVKRPADGSQAALEAGRKALLAVLLASLVSLFVFSPVMRANVSTLFAELGDPTSKFSIREMGVTLPELRRGGISFDPETAQTLVKIGNALDRHTQQGEGVLFFPNEAAYYFLFDRPVPTRYVQAYFAITSDQRREMVAALERRRPAIVVYSLESWRVDNIPEHVQVPEVVSYLRQEYSVIENLGDILILRRKG